MWVCWDLFEGKLIERAEVEVKISELKNGKATGRDEITGETIEGVGDRVVDWIWRQCNMTFESDIVSEDRKYALIIPLLQG